MKHSSKTKKELIKLVNELEDRIHKLEAIGNHNSDKHTDSPFNDLTTNITTKKYQSIFEGAAEGIAHADKDTTILDVNPAFTEITGIPKEEIVGKSGALLARKFVNTKQLPQILSLIKSAINKKSFRPYELAYNGKILEISAKRQSNGQTVGILRDVTKRRQMEDALKSSEERLKIIYENAPDPIFMGTPEGIIVDGNKAAEEMIGYKKAELVGTNIFNLNLINKTQFPKIMAAIAKSALGLKTGPVEYKVRRKDGSRFIVDISTFPVKIDNKPIILCIAHDITERKETEKALRISEEKYRSLFEKSADAILIIEGGMFVDCNQAALDMLGYSNKNNFLQIHPSSLSPVEQPDGQLSYDKAEKMMSIAYTKGSHRFEWNHKRRNGEVFPVEVLLTAIPSGNDRFLHVVWRDITQRKKAEENLIKSQQKYKSYFELDISGIFLSTMQGKILDHNPAFAKMLGYSNDEIREINAINLYPDPAQRTVFLEKLKKERVLANFEINLLKKNGELIHCIENVIGTFNENNEILYFQGYILDITNIINAELALKEQVIHNKLVMDTMTDGYVLTNANGKILDANSSYCKMIQYELHELKQLNIFNLDITFSEKEITKRTKKFQQTGKDRFETRQKKKNGEFIDFEVNSAIIQKPEGLFAVSILRDITDQKKATELLKVNEQKLRNIFEHSTNMFYTHTVDNKLTYLSPQVKNILGYTEEEALVKWTKFTTDHPANKIGFQLTERAIKTGKAQQPYELELYRKDGTKIWVEIREAPIVKNNKTTAIVGAMVDITGRIRNEQALKESERLLSKSQNVANIGSYVMDIQKGNWESSSTLLRIFGIDSTYSKNVEGWLNIVHIDDRDMMRDYFLHEVVGNKKSFNKEYRIKRISDNAVRWVHGIGELEMDNSGEPVKMIGTIQDITERKLIDNALQESELKYRSLIENSNDAIYLLYNNKFEVINNKVTEMFGYTLDELNTQGFSYEKLVSPKSRQFFIDRQKQYLAGNLRADKYEIKLITKTGKELDVEISDTFISYKDGIANQGIIRDITERKNQQKLLMKTTLKVQEEEKFNFGKELHDGLGQILITASMYLESLRKVRNQLPPDKRNDLEQARKLYKQAISDARRISHGLMITGIEEYDLSYLIKQLCLNASVPELKFKYIDGNIDENKINREKKVHIYRIIQELSSNILKHANASEASIIIDMASKHELKVVVEDNGKGFKADEIIKGAGLRNVEHRINMMEGKSNILSNIGKGTVFNLTVPL